jgi:hypothetical protein
MIVEIRRRSGKILERETNLRNRIPGKNKLILKVLSEKIFLIRGVQFENDKSDENELRLFSFDQGLELLKDITAHPKQSNKNEKRLKLARSCIDIAIDNSEFILHLRKERNQKITELGLEYDLCEKLPKIILSLYQEKATYLEKQAVLNMFLGILTSLSKFSSSEEGYSFRMAENFLLSNFTSENRVNTKSLNLNILTPFFYLCRGSNILDIIEH